MQRVKFSIIVPVYNVKKFVAECLDSVLMQTYDDWECICVDDGSEDGSGDVLDCYARKDVRFVVVHQSNKGVSAARNNALERITGQWFLFLDSDDVLAPSTLANCRNAIDRERDVDLFSFGSVRFDESEICRFCCNSEIPILRLQPTLGPYNHLWGRFSATGKVYRWNIFGDLREKSYVVGEDLLYLTECMLRVSKIARIDCDLYGYRQRNGSAVHGGGEGLRVMLDSLYYLADMAILLKSARRELVAATQKWLGNNLTERTVWEYWQLTSKDDQQKIRNAWYEVLRELNQCRRLGWFQQIRIALLLSWRSCFFEWWLCYLPSLLKRRIWRRR